MTDDAAGVTDAGSSDLTAAGRRRAFPPSMSGVLATAMVVWAITSALRGLNDNSFLTHLATGRLILDGGVPGGDPYSFTAPGADWVVQSWLASVLYAGADELGGGRAILVLQGVLAGVLAALVVRLTRPASSITTRLAAAALGVAIGTVTWVERPLIIGLIGFALILVLLREPERPAWLLVPVLWVWANSHGSYPLAVVLLLTVAAGQRLDGVDVGRTLRLAMFTVAGIVAAIVGPLTLDVLTFPFELLGRRDVLDNIVEWKAPSFTSTGERLFLLQALVALATLVRRPSWARAVPTLVFLAAALVASRNIAVASLVLVPVIAEGLAGLGKIKGDRRSPLMAGAVVALVVLVALAVVRVDRRPAYRLGAYPTAALAWLEAEGRSEPGDRLVAPDFVGNLRTLLEGDEAEVFIDDRYDMWPRDLVEDYETLLRARPGWERVLRDREATGVLWQASQPLAALLKADADWRVVFNDGEWLVAEPRS